MLQLVDLVERVQPFENPLSEDDRIVGQPRGGIGGGLGRDRAGVFAYVLFEL